jgi:hypothetical protein
VWHGEKLLVALKRPLMEKTTEMTGLPQLDINIQNINGS